MKKKRKVRLMMLGLTILKIVNLLLLVATIVCFPIGIYRMIVDNAYGQTDGLFFGLSLGSFACYFITGFVFKMLYKKGIVTDVLRAEIPGCNWSISEGFGQGVIDSNIRLVESGNRYKSEDLIYGEYKGYHFEQADVSIENVVTERIGYGRHRHTKVRVFKHFKGRMIILDSPTIVKKPVYAFSYYFEHRYSGMYDKLTSDEIKDKVFGDLFDVKVQKGGSARTVLDEKMKKALLTTYKKFNNMAVHFEEKKMYIAINTKESTFDWRWTRGFSYRKEIEANRNQIGVIKDIVDILTSDENLQEISGNNANNEEM